MKAITFISAEQFGQVRGDASNTFLMSRAQALRRSRCDGVGLSGALSPGRADCASELASRFARAARVRLE